MSALALALVLLAAIFHAIWNLFAKRSGGGMGFVLLVGIVNVVLYAPFVIGYWWWKHPTLALPALGWIAGSGVLKTGYALFLQRSYRSGDFSLMYPLARGTGPLLATAAAIAVFGERPRLIALAGGLLIVASIFFLADGTRVWREREPRVRKSIFYGVASGVFIAAYTLWDRRGVATLGIAPLLYDAGTTVTSVLLLAPFSVQRAQELDLHWREHRGYVVGVAVLSSIAYILVLTALSFTPVSYVAPAREISIVMGAIIGARYLKEGNERRRLISAIGIVVGIVALSL